MSRKPRATRDDSLIDLLDQALAIRRQECHDILKIDGSPCRELEEDQIGGERDRYDRSPHIERLRALLIEATGRSPAKSSRPLDRFHRFRAIQTIGGHVFGESFFAETFGQGHSLGGGHARESLALFLLELLGQLAAHHPRVYPSELLQHALGRRW